MSMSYFSVEGVKAGFAQLASAPLLTQVLVGVAAVSALLLVGYGLYKFCKWAKGASCKAKNDTPSEEPKKHYGLGQRLKRWWNRASLIETLENKVATLEAEQTNVNTSLGAKENIANSKAAFNTLDCKLDDLNKRLEDSQSRTAALEAQVVDLNAHVPLMNNITEFLKRNSETVKANAESQKAQEEARKAAQALRTASQAEQDAAKKVLEAPAANDKPVEKRKSFWKM